MVAWSRDDLVPISAACGQAVSNQDGGDSSPNAFRDRDRNDKLNITLMASWFKISLRQADLPDSQAIDGFKQ
jgi:hypothetical protein